ncbi:hypothetical protein QR98_0091290 [Sarcoptes scabiei]|uniref:Uncharacterized protein n=1 Tax=Sarcoptes scabiei TaxID=52283 RepID=A0A132AHU9_SARSC|nr:hypothetical protein QR98_0091290 [Sarcoptes scabiei]
MLMLRDPPCTNLQKNQKTQHLCNDKAVKYHTYTNEDDRSPEDPDFPIGNHNALYSRKHSNHYQCEDDDVMKSIVH